MEVILMDTNAKRYLELISQHLQEHHAALFVGSGFSLNADKVTSDVPDIPLWAGLAQKFKEKLGDSDQKRPSRIGRECGNCVWP